jgi:site-specific recombinase XerD
MDTRNVKHLLTALHKEAGYDGTWPVDVSRHTFASHFAAFSGSLAAVAFTMNHKTIGTTIKFYRRRVSQAAGKAYFKLRPGKKRLIV